MDPVSCKTSFCRFSNIDLNDIDGVVLAQEPSMGQFPEYFQEDMTFNLDFLDDRAWSMGMGEVPMFGTSQMN
jgi:hypothetical protein